MRMRIRIEMTIQSKWSWVGTRAEKTEGWTDRSLLCRSENGNKILMRSMLQSWLRRSLAIWHKIVIGILELAAHVWGFFNSLKIDPRLHKIIITFQMIPFIVRQNNFYNFSIDPFHHCDLPSPCKCSGQTPCNNTYHYHYCCCCCCCYCYSNANVTRRSIHPNLSIHPVL